MNHSRDSRLRLILATLALAALALGASDKSGAEKQKSLAERMYDNRVKRCKAMMLRTRCRAAMSVQELLRREASRPAPNDDGSDHEGAASGRNVLQVRRDLSRVRRKMLGGKMMYTIYRLDRAKDGSDNYSMYVWSREY